MESPIGTKPKMANTYTQIHIQLFFVVKYRYGLIGDDWRDNLYKYITSIVQNNNHKLLIINGMPDHIHLLIGLRPDQSISELAQKVKANSSKWINDQGFIKGRFEWQSGFGAFSYTKSDVPMVINYIINQETHHKKKSFREEYRDLLKKFDIDFDEKYIFKELE